MVLKDIILAMRFTFSWRIMTSITYFIMDPKMLWNPRGLEVRGRIGRKC